MPAGRPTPTAAGSMGHKDRGPGAPRALAHARAAARPSRARGHPPAPAWTIRHKDRFPANTLVLAPADVDERDRVRLRGTGPAGIGPATGTRAARGGAPAARAPRPPPRRCTRPPAVPRPRSCRDWARDRISGDPWRRTGGRLARP